MDYQKVKGTHDFIGEDAKYLSYIRETFFKVTSLFNYNEHVIPTMEYSEVFSRGVGEGSDVVRKEMYSFLDKGYRSVTLRPEFTAGIVRSVVENKLYATEVLPIKSSYLGQSFRYERPQAGRYREFYQGGVECIGVTGIDYDVEIIQLCLELLKRFHLDDKVSLSINYLGGIETRDKYTSALTQYFRGHIDEMCDDCKERITVNPLRILDCKEERDQKVAAKAPEITSYLSEKEKADYDAIKERLTLLGIEYHEDTHLVRGLDYYSGLVFEFKVPFEDNAVCGGGHYDNLVSELGGPELEGVGFSFGIERLIQFMKDNNIAPESKKIKSFYIMPLDKEISNYALRIAKLLRENDYIAEINYDGGKIASMFKKAERLDLDYGIIIGVDEANAKTVQLKDLHSQEQVTIPFDKLIEEISK